MSEAAAPVRTACLLSPKAGLSGKTAKRLLDVVGCGEELHLALLAVYLDNRLHTAQH